MNILSRPLKRMAVSFAAICCCVGAVKAQVMAFPGARGFGKNATGGRGGSVYHVTNLNDDGAGSFRDAVSTSNRIVVFDVGGYIKLKTAVSVKSNITIAGQTAPGQGIGFEGGEISFASSSNIICRYIRIRPGSETSSSTDDGLSFYRAQNIIADHVSVEFAPWNNIDGVSDDWQKYPVGNITVQNSIIADPTGQQFGAHTEAVNGTWAWFNNIFVNSHNRNPLAKVNTVFVNNILYNCSAGYTTHTSTNFSHDIVNNYFILGPASGSTDNTWFQVDKNQSIYYSGNLKDSIKDGILNGGITTPYWYQGPGTILTSPFSTTTTESTIYNPKTAFMLAASHCGTMPRDAVDSLVINQMKTLGSGTVGTGIGTTGPDASLYTTQSETGLANNGYGNITGGQKATDMDNDGIPDYWENAYGSDPNTNDAMNLAKDGYTILEHYINWMADPNATTTLNQSVDIDLLKYASEFGAEGAVFSFANASNGTCSLLSDGHTVRFTPTAGFSGFGDFDFSVTTSDGTYQSNVSIAITNTPIYSPLPVAATSPTPASNQSFPGQLSTNLTLSWKGGVNTDSYNLYFGTSASDLVEMTAMPYSASASYPISNVQYNTTYYWRVDAVGPSGTTTGQVWSFTTGAQTQLAARYKLDESAGTTVTDASVNHDDGIANFTPDWNTSGGALQGAIGFSQATAPTSAIIIPSSSANLFDNSSFTISLWVKIPSNTYTYSNGKDCYLIQKGSFEANTGKWYGIQLKDGTLTFAVDDGTQKSSLSVSLSGANNIFDNTWKNIVAVRDTSLKQISLYIDGVKAGSTSTSGTKGNIGQTDKPLTIGNSTENKPYRDMMDDIRLYDNVLSDNDISDLYAMKDAITVPVSIVSFSVEASNNIVNLKWVTATEINNQKFEIQRSAGGKTFSTLADIPANKNSSGLTNYQFTDEHPNNGINYYRLIQYDQNGKATIIGTRVASIFLGNSIFKIYPNPSSNGKINFTLPVMTGKPTFSATIMALNGSLVKKVILNTNKSKTYSLNLNKEIATGIYLLLIEHDGMHLSQKVIFRNSY